MKINSPRETFFNGIIYAITRDEPPNLSLIEKQLIAHHICILQYRRKNTPSNLKIKEAKSLQSLCATHNVRFIINDDITLCHTISADGVHLGQSDSSITLARKILGESAIIGVSCHNSVDLAVQAYNSGANYIGVGTIYPSQNKPHATQCSLEELANIRNNMPLPIIAIGGITFANYHKPLDYGADMVAMIDGLW